jgi:tRNA(Arg) A34 adenosine deaminase TadA
MLYELINIRRLPFIDEAMKQAEKSNVRYKHGAVVVDKTGKIIAVGYNKYRLSCYAKYKICIHAEIDAISKCSAKMLNGATLYVIRLNSGGELQSSKPCERCKDYIIRSRIYACYHT